MKKYRKKPVVIEAMMYLPGDMEQAGRLMGWFVACNFQAFTFFDGPGSKTKLRILTLEGRMTANPGDWIIRGVQGEFYPCKPEIFHATYELVVDEVDGVAGQE